MKSTVDLFKEFREVTTDDTAAAVLTLVHVLSNPTPADSSINVEQAATYLGVAKQTVYDLVNSGRVSHHRIGKKRGTIRFSRSDLERFRENAQREPSDLFAKHTGA